ncbi:MAG: hypothetical protein E7Z78_06350 [Methanobrevibacter thaueri]|jgi:hypothetical protein|uniref:hypothetical protein n=1 Tax=Methanobrevibacter thaueri TaxID=190975 RepID=UPI0026EB8D33|nr:hypothetical protein [Methanobrevibacter thaueri]MBE6496052.1 hypothetical protein [Methanobrevibacter thaueri]
MRYKILIFALALFLLINTASAIDSSNWTTATVGYENFKIPPEYENPYSSDFNMYEYDYDIDVFTVRYVNPRIIDLYGYFLERNDFKKVKVAGHDAVHFTSHDRHDDANNSKLWFSAGEEFYYIAWRGTNITPEIKEVVKSASKSKYSHDEFYDILDENYQNYKITHAIESQRYDYPTSDKGHHSFVSVGSNGVNFGVMT